LCESAGAQPSAFVSAIANHSAVLVLRLSGCWRIERLFAWFHHSADMCAVGSYYVGNFFGMVRLGCMHVLFGY
jgi:hypothetical protein